MSHLPENKTFVLIVFFLKYIRTIEYCTSYLCELTLLMFVFFAATKEIIERKVTLVKVSYLHWGISDIIMFGLKNRNIVSMGNERRYLRKKEKDQRENTTNLSTQISLFKLPRVKIERIFFGFFASPFSVPLFLLSHYVIIISVVNIYFFYYVTWKW